jgi:hypothetical protein
MDALHFRNQTVEAHGVYIGGTMKNPAASSGVSPPRSAVSREKAIWGFRPQTPVGSRTKGSRFSTAASGQRAGRRVSNGVATLIASAA